MRPASFTCVLVFVLVGCLGSSIPPDGTSTLPSAERCAMGALPDPETTDGLQLSEYPVPPERVNDSTVAGYVVAFERAYFRNQLIAQGAADPTTNLTRATANAEPRRVARRDDGWAVVLATSGGTKYERGIHGDHWPTVGYFVNASRLTRAPVAGANASVRNSQATTLLRCPA